MALTITGQTSPLTLLAAISRLTRQQSQVSERLTTAKRVNHASDDPAGVIAISMFNSEIAGVEAALSNNERADAMLDVADGALAEISSLLTSISSLVSQAAGSTTLTDAEIAANQLQIDSAIESIDRIVRTTTFNGQRLLDGSAAIQTSLSAADAAKIKDVQVHARPSASTNGTLSINVTQAATKASTASTGWVDMSGANATLSAATTMTITGKLGSATVQIASGADQQDVIDAINEVTGLTGVVASASATTATAIKLESQDYGEDATISVQVLSGDADFAAKEISQISGTDATVLVNGSPAGVDGTRVSWVGNGYSVSFTLADNSTGTRTITVTGGGATFQLGSDSGTRATIGIPGLYSHLLGEAGTGYLSELKSGGAKELSTDVAGAASVISKVITQVSTTRARIGGFQKYQVQSSINALEAAREGLTDARSAIEDADLAAETANMNRLQLLLDTTISMLSVSNTRAESILSLLR